MAPFVTQAPRSTWNLEGSGETKQKVDHEPTSNEGNVISLAELASSFEECGCILLAFVRRSSRNLPHPALNVKHDKVLQTWLGEQVVKPSGVLDEFRGFVPRRLHHNLVALFQHDLVACAPQHENWHAEALQHGLKPRRSSLQFEDVPEGEFAAAHQRILLPRTERCGVADDEPGVKWSSDGQLREEHCRKPERSNGLCTGMESRAQLEGTGETNEPRPQALRQSLTCDSHTAGHNHTGVATIRCYGSRGHRSSNRSDAPPCVHSKHELTSA
mmetsp:Transcript_66387/g.214547  ORF Transcript_66387/g.214547 Transcript_66387/m.214547 type:complete len:272 (-) Transcript_66387:731-1546(-)